MRRSPYSLRHTMCLMQKAPIYQIAKNCRTNVEMIEKFYVAPIKNMINAAAVNVRKDRSDDGPAKRPRKSREGKVTGTRDAADNCWRTPLSPL